MATDKTYSVCGVTKFNGDYKVRWAHDIMRIKILNREGHEDIRLADLNGEFDKYTCVQMISTHPDFADADAQACIQEYLETKAPRVKASVKQDAETTE